MIEGSGYFPTVRWGALGADATFLPGGVLPEASRGHLWAVLTFVFYGDKVALADIPDRGYCVPSGRIEPGETVFEAAMREVFEETGARIKDEAHQLIGCFRLSPLDNMSDTAHVRYCPTFIVEALGFEDLPEGSESRGKLLCPVEDVAGLYYTWDDLLDRVFEYAASLRTGLVLPGLRLTELTRGPDA